MLLVGVPVRYAHKYTDTDSNTNTITITVGYGIPKNRYGIYTLSEKFFNHGYGI